jgi:predicted dithiol-disulfide oxidoreductase (DUF899 family)
MTESTAGSAMKDLMREERGAPKIVDRSTFQTELDALRVREKAHTRAGDAIAAARRRLPMVEADPTITPIGPHGPVKLLEAFEGRRQLITYYFMWHTVILRRSSARGARGSPPRSRSCLTFILATSPMRSSLRAPTKRASATVTSCAGRSLGTQRKALSMLYLARAG